MGLSLFAGNDDLGGPDPLASDFDCGDCDGYDEDFKPHDTIYVRILTRDDKQIPQMAVRISSLDSPQTIWARAWAEQTSDFDKAKFPFHDLYPTSDLSMGFDNTAPMGSEYWLANGDNEPPTITIHSPVSGEIVACDLTVTGTATADPLEIARWLQEQGTPAEVVPGPGAGLDALFGCASVRLVVGSFYLVGAVRQRLGMS